MVIHPFTDLYAVSPQISPVDLSAIKSAGYSVLIDNRPDSEVTPDLQASEIGRAARALGLQFVANPVVGSAITVDNIAIQRELIQAESCPVLAYCASGMRSALVWAMAEVARYSVDELLGMTARQGYQLDQFRPQLQILAKQTLNGRTPP